MYSHIKKIIIFSLFTICFSTQTIANNNIENNLIDKNIELIFTKTVTNEYCDNNGNIIESEILRCRSVKYYRVLEKYDSIEVFFVMENEDPLLIYKKNQFSNTSGEFIYSGPWEKDLMPILEDEIKKYEKNTKIERATKEFDKLKNNISE
jgi:hypothetical protein